MAVGASVTSPLAIFSRVGSGLKQLLLDCGRRAVFTLGAPARVSHRPKVEVRPIPIIIVGLSLTVVVRARRRMAVKTTALRRDLFRRQGGRYGVGGCARRGGHCEADGGRRLAVPTTARVGSRGPTSEEAVSEEALVVVFSARRAAN